MLTANQAPEQQARNKINALLIQPSWLIQNKSQLNLSTAKGIAIHEYRTDIGPAEPGPFNQQGCLGKMWQLFGEETDSIIELNERLVA